ncbi:lactosylceramide 1,3-N-acetyl-beta-D-glucosaminyltransferase A-like [Portunus trituberculatus]|uniref:lactosylceramide 1,3-N-acetyl-beta-D-glucosaminyltransferase A-like n=1 Tax=Portunus trituberculatus TaxID=210409 RepID=UPI001E1CD9C8|nr:lactosylceramide 1,3-N-acetyl-beta-D-glucosaminyltransferase A-like [Portunus trituberculatus]XP_045117246.1 lactosylceramide 1,3-N-acetyl-beta-D-glucosaminyltransferase A-like [Portunus trituberculatus]
MATRRSVAWDFVVVVVGAAALVFLVCFTWEADQYAGPPPPAPLLPRRPAPRGPPELFPPPGPLLDMPAVSFVSNTECFGERLLLAILVVSHPANAALRDAHRAHVPWEALDALGARRVFVLADASGAGQPEYPSVGRQQVALEAGRHRDLVVADFPEHYRSLTYKHVLALSWAAAFCPSAAFLLKMDDDIMVDVWALAALLRAGPALDAQGRLQAGLVSGGRPLARHEAWTAGLVQRGLRPQRAGGKWRVTQQEYAGHVYPDFLSGWAYLATRPAATALLQAAARLPPFWIDDVHVTGTAAALAGVPRYALNRHYTLLPSAAACCLDLSTRHDAPLPSPAPLCDLLVAPSGKNVTLMAAWLTAARRCHLEGVCPVTFPAACRATHLRQGVGTVIKLS